MNGQVGWDTSVICAGLSVAVYATNIGSEPRTLPVPTKNSIGAVNLSSCEDCYRIDALRGVGVQTEFQNERH